MKLTEAKLKLIINEVLEEAARGSADLPEIAYVKIETGMDYGQKYYAAFYADQNGNQLYSNSDDVPHGYVKILEKVDIYEQFPCLDAMMVSYSQVAGGWGPLLYDVVMEIATMKGGGLVSDRTVLSSEGYAVWEFYANNRPDVEKIQLDNEAGDLTPDDYSDDCLQSTTYDYANLKRTRWTSVPISKMYRKQPEMLDALRAAGKLLGEENL